MIKVNYWKTFIILLFFWSKQYAQFRPVLTEGDYAPVAVKLNVEEKNKKHKDVPRIYFDKDRNLWHATWTQFDAYKSKQKKDLSVIYYSRSEEGKSWGTPKQLNTVSGDCLDGDSTVKGPMPCVGTIGEVYVIWAAPQGLAFQRSLDSGKTWSKEEKIIAPIKKGWASKVDGLKTNGLPFIACDLSRGEFRGRIYVCWSDEKNSEKNKDVFLIYSDDKGEHWTEPILVSYRPNHKEQFKPYLKVDTVSGYVYVLYFDKQNFAEGKETDIYLALSKNGGLKFDYYKMNEKSFLFNSNYMELADDNGMRAKWVQVDGSKRFGLYEVLINDSTLSSYNVWEYNNEMKIERSFKFTDKIKLDFDINTNTFLSATITKPLEPGFEKFVIKNKRVFAGKNNLLIDTKALALKKGNYVLTLYYGNQNTYVWIMEE